MASSSSRAAGYSQSTPISAPRMPKRAKDESEEEEEEEEDDSGDDEEESKKSKKKADSGKSKMDSGKSKDSGSSGKLTKDKDGYWTELGEKEVRGTKNQKRLTVQSFKGTVSVHLREYYEKDGKMLPGKGIALSPEQFEMAVAMADQVKEAVAAMK